MFKAQLAGAPRKVVETKEEFPSGRIFDEASQNHALFVPKVRSQHLYVQAASALQKDIKKLRAEI